MEASGASFQGADLLLDNMVEGEGGVDALGTYVDYIYTWIDSPLSTTVKIYPDDSSTLVFEQHVAEDVESPGFPQGFAQSAFPIFKKNSLDHFSYKQFWTVMESGPLTSYSPSHQGGVPLVIYNSSEPSLPMTVFSPLTDFKSVHLSADSDTFSPGILSNATFIPKGFSATYVLSASSGINKGMMDWGDKLLSWNDKPRTDMFVDATHSTIGFWTDNGGYYHYSTGEDETRTYEEVLPEVKVYHDEIGVPFGHWQFDSWFYPKDGPVDNGGGGGGVTNWTADPTIFPTGMPNINELLDGMPTVMHNRQWSATSDYIKNWDFEWYIDDETQIAIPKDPAAFFTRFFQEQKDWGLSMYEQDWIMKQYDLTESLYLNLTLGDLWHRGMGEGASAAGLSVQYCMPYPNDILSSVMNKAVTNIRATDDYFHGADRYESNWPIGQTAMLIHALGALPFKDGFYSSTNEQRGGQEVGPELHPDRHAIMATLSTAMVGPMDGINLLNASRVMSTCNADGLILKPDMPVTTPDYCYLGGKKGEDCMAYFTVSGNNYYFFDNDGDGEFGLEMVDKLEGAEGEYVVYNWYTGESQSIKAGERVTLEAGYEGHSFAVVSPFGDVGVAFIGEVDKIVTNSKARFDHLEGKVKGAAGERVKQCWVGKEEGRSGGLKTVCEEVVLDGEGVGVMVKMM
ncbi:hypothetical protein TrLO_g8075 [Triparma laevis f. longispina]|uniref:Uncharacterized protein n=1 Tax=Triparma laevis f. longispina TaxID=1714387 RepID=A0A9W7DZ88_9STRA|nr:hypothetical protein TrLO_g8075 [Triparma laevis f. longispina]